MVEFAVFNRRIYTGTISTLPYPTRLAWGIVMFEGEKLRGKVKLPVYDLSRWASIAVEEAAAALQQFQEPDPHSSSKMDEGRRLRPIPDEEDWYEIINWEKHAKEREIFFNRLRQQRFKAKAKEVTVSNGGLRQVTKEPEPEPEPEQTTLSDGGLAEVRAALGSLVPLMNVRDASILLWLAVRGTWWLLALICEEQGNLRSHATAAYLGAVVKRRDADGWAPDDAEGYARHMLAKVG